MGLSILIVVYYAYLVVFVTGLTVVLVFQENDLPSSNYCSIESNQHQTVEDGYIYL